MTLFLIILFSIFSSLGAILMAGVFLLMKSDIQKKVVPYIISYSIGALIASAFLGLIPEALENIVATRAFTALVFGIFAFFLLEKLVIWRHCHQKDCDAHITAASVILIGDAFHNFADGVILAAAFLTSLPLGITAGFSIIAHEIPQELGDFAILLHSGYSNKKALFFNALSGFSALLGAIFGYFALAKASVLIPYVLIIAASSFIYISLADLTPELHRKTDIRESLIQLFLIFFGVFTTIILLSFLH